MGRVTGHPLSPAFGEDLMNFCKAVGARFVSVAASLGAGCASSAPDAEVALTHALARAQRDAANASWDSILNAAAQRYRQGHGLALDAPLTDEQHDAVNAIAHENLARILAHVDGSETALIEAIGVDDSHRAQRHERLVREVEQAERSFKEAVLRQTGYVVGN
jgi:hypothetical protein